jgi:acyl transferase domain-containing protein/NADP-dependent 3-hydroxy acid dehydrogenase YdfG
MSDSRGQGGIAVVGLGGLFPQATNLREFWRNVYEAADCITEVPPTHWRPEDHHDPDPNAPDKTYATRGGFVPHVGFDPMEFGLPPNILGVTDVLQLLSLVVAKQTLVDAGTDADWYDPARTGVVLGITGANSLTQPLATRLQTPVLKEVVRSCGLSEADVEHIADTFVKAFAPWEEHSFPGMLGNVVAGRIANRLDLGGINCTIDAACASSLAAVRMAIDELESGRADLMLSGGCDAENTILMYLCFSKTPALSRGGTIRPFDQNCDGTLIGEGMGMLALKRLADAERDGDRIYSVIRGMGASSDGRFKSIYAPRREGQVVALHRAYHEAGFGPETVGLIECHGTGTKVGDMTEMSALLEVYSGATDDRQFAAVGSVKSQIGHTKAAAGAASLIKVSLALHQKILPPTINVEQPRGDVDFPNSPFYVNTRTRPWLREPHRPVRRAAVSSFGFGGTNFHCLLQEHDPTGTALHVLHPAAKVHLWHAADRAALVEAVENLPDGTSRTADGIPADAARIGFVATGAQEATELRDRALTALRERADVDAFDLPEGVWYRQRAAELGQVAAMFAGQGSQYVGMGAEATMAVPPVRGAWDAATLAMSGDEPLSRVVFPPPAFSDTERTAQEEALRRTRYAQPAIGALSMGQYRYLSELGFAPDAVIGHSFGELTALWAARSLTDQAFLTLATARGAAMATLPPGATDRGAMAAVRADEQQLAPLLVGQADVVVCNRNAPQQVVVGGGTQAMADFCAAARAAGLHVQELPVSAAFHTRYVAHAVAPFAEVAATVRIDGPQVPVYPNTADAGYGDDPAANRNVLVQQLVKPVAFGPRIRQMYDAGCRTFVEFGPRGVLSGLTRQILRGHADVRVLSADPGPGADSDRALKRLAARLAVLGLPLHGFNRYTAADDRPPVAKKRMEIKLNGVNYVPPQRRADYEAALNSGYQAHAPHSVAPAAMAAMAPGNGVAVDGTPTTATPANGTPTNETADGTPTNGAASNGTHGTAANGSNGTSGNGGEHATSAVEPPAVRSALADLRSITLQHIAMHQQYLGSQLRVSEQVADLLANAASSGGPSQTTVSGLTAVAEQSVAIGQSHIHASDVLRSLVQWESGVAPESVRITTEPVPAPLQVHATRMPSQTPMLAATTAAPVTVESFTAEPLPARPGAGPGTTELAPSQDGFAPAAPAGDVISLESDRETFLVPTPDPTPPPRPVARSATPVAAAAAPMVVPTMPAPVSVAPAPVLVPAPAAPTPAPATPAPTPAPTAAGAGHADQISAVLLEVVAEKTGYPADMLELSMDIEADLGIDSIKRVEIMGALRDRFPQATAITPESLGELRVLNDIVNVMAGAVSGEANHPKADGAPAISRFQARLLRLPAADTSRELFPENPVAQLVGGDTDPLLLQVHAALTRLGFAVRTGGLPAAAAPVDLVVSFLPTVNEPSRLRDVLRDTVLLAGAALPGLRLASGRAGFVTVTRVDGVAGMSGTAGVTGAVAGVAGLTRTLAVEEPRIFCRAVDLHPALPPERVAEALLAEVLDVRQDLAEVAVDADAGRWTVGLDSAGTASAPLPDGQRVEPPGPGDVLVVTGGARGITGSCVTALAAEYGCELVLVGRTPVTDADPGWAVGVPDADLRAAIANQMRESGTRPTPREVARVYRSLTAEREVRDTLAAVRGTGASVHYVAADVTDAGALGVALTPWRGRITGVVHGAGVLADALVADKRADDVDRVLAVKLDGLTAALAAVAGELLRHIVLFASAAGFFGNRGQADYAVANSAFNRIACGLRRERPGTAVTSINWGAWAGGMVTPELERMFAERGVTLIPRDQGVALFVDQFRADRSGDVVVVAGTDQPLTPAVPSPSAATRIRRDLSPLWKEPVLADHSIGGVPVLPATVALGGLLNVAARVRGQSPVAVRDFRIFKGVVGDDTSPEGLLFSTGPGEHGLRVTVTDDTGRPRYGGEVLFEPPAVPPQVELPAVAGEPTTAYHDGTLFHGPSLRGVRTEAPVAGGLLVGLRLADHELAHGAYALPGYRPVLADLLLQAVLVAARRHTGSPSLPTAIERLETYAPLPDTEPFAAVVRIRETGDRSAVCDVTAASPDGVVLCRLTGVRVVLSPTLAGKFAGRE